MKTYRSIYILVSLITTLFCILLAAPELRAQAGRPYESDCIRISPDTLFDFGEMPIGVPSVTTVTVYNKRSTPIMIDRVSTDGGYCEFYSVVSPSLPIQIDAADSQEVTIRFEATWTPAPGVDLFCGFLFRFDGLGVDTNICPYVLLMLLGRTPTAGVDEAEHAVLEMYPNPAHTTLRVSLTDPGVTTATVYDLLGREMLRASVDGEAEIDVSQLPSGVYMLSAGGEVRRFVVGRLNRD